ncbi:MAG: kynureninase [Chitinophagaceae bacterium]
MQFQNSLSFARQLDEKDPLKSFREKFILPTAESKQQIYFLGNSLGLQPEATEAALTEILKQWGTYGVEGFFKGEKPWMNYHDQLISPLAEIVGALPIEIVVMNQLTVNLHLMMVSFYRPSGKRRKIICEARAFPSDQYMFETHLKHYGFNPNDELVEVSPRAGEHTIRTEDILESINKHKDELALVFWGGLNYYTGQVFDMQTITIAAQSAGAKVGFDLAHAAGNIPLKLHNWNVDFACWCSYKYLNAGPGAVGGVYIHERYHSDISIQRFAGWWGYNKDTRFNMDKGFNPIRSAEGWQLSTPSMLLFAAQKAALDIFTEAGIDRLHEKRILLNNYLWYVLEEAAKNSDEEIIDVITPREQELHGCQVSILMQKRGREIYEELMKSGIIVDWRQPNVIRLAPVPLYNTFEEVWAFGNCLGKLLMGSAAEKLNT